MVTEHCLVRLQESRGLEVVYASQTTCSAESMAVRVLQPHQHAFVTTLRRWCAWDLNDALVTNDDALVTSMHMITFQLSMVHD